VKLFTINDTRNEIRKLELPRRRKYVRSQRVGVGVFDVHARLKAIRRKEEEGTRDVIGRFRPVRIIPVPEEGENISGDHHRPNSDVLGDAILSVEGTRGNFTKRTPP